MVGKTAMVGIKERDSKKIESFKVADTKAITLHQIVHASVSTGPTVYTETPQHTRVLNNELTRTNL